MTDSPRDPALPAPAEGVDIAAVTLDGVTLAARLVAAPDHTQAAVELRAFHNESRLTPEQRDATLISALSVFALHVALVAPLDTLPSGDGLLARFHRLAIAARGLGFYRGGTA